MAGVLCVGVVVVWGSRRIVFQWTCILLLWGCVVTAVQAESERDSAAATRAAHASAIQSAGGPAEELAEIRLQLAEAYEELNKENAILNQMQREHERKDPIARGLREKMVAVEKDLVQMRQSLHSRLEAIEEVRDIESRRKELLADVKDLKQQERKLLAGTRGKLAVESGKAGDP